MNRLYFYTFIAFLPLLFWCFSHYAVIREKYLWVLIWIILVSLAGLRLNIGADWQAYANWYEYAEVHDALQTIFASDPGYMLINWISANLELGIAGVNTICSIIAVSGLLLYCRAQPLPWVSLYVAIPYLFIVVFMGYTRQSASIGLFLIGLSFLNKSKFYAFIICIFCAALFHSSVVFMFFLLVVDQRVSLKLRLICMLLCAPIILCIVFFYAEYWTVVYIDTKMESAGTYWRVALNIIPVVALLLCTKSFKNFGADFCIIRAMFFVSIISLPLISFASTAVDRMLLYFFPLQMSCWSRLLSLNLAYHIRAFTFIFVFSLYLILLLVWLNYSANSEHWLPYKSYLNNIFQ